MKPMTEKPNKKDEFLSPIGKFYGEFSPENVVFDANLQEFASRISIICALENGGRISSLEAYQQIKAIWGQLRDSKRNLFDRKDN